MNTSSPLISNYLPRTLEAVVARASSRYKGTLVTAGRKKHDVAPDDGQRRHVNLDRFQALDLARNAPDAFFKQYPLPALIDEFQRALNLVRTKLARSSY